jgi:hypothetical protein
MAVCISPWTELHHYRQSDESIRAERYPLWMDTGAAGSGATNVADCRFYLWKSGASGSATWGDCTRQPRSHSQSRRSLLETNRSLVNAFLADHSELDCEPSRFGTTVFPRLRTGDVATFAKLLRDEFETSVVPGEFFEQPQHLRIGLCGATETVRGGLERLSAALESFR